MKKTTRVTMTILLAAIAVLARGPVWAQGNCTGALSLNGEGGTLAAPGSVGLVLPPDTFSFTPDLSNPGARALALGGAFVATADDSTSIITNPAGLGSLVTKQLQVELRYRPVVQYDTFGNSGVISTYDGATTTTVDPFNDTSGQTPPVFGSFVLPAGDKLVLGVAYQLLAAYDRDVNRIPATANDATKAAGPCFETLKGGFRTYVPLYNLHEEQNLYRVAASLAYRLVPNFTLGVSFLWNHENRLQTIRKGSAAGVVAEDLINIDTLSLQMNTSSGKPSFLVGFLFNATKTLRVGAAYSHKVEFDPDNEASDTRITRPQDQRTLAFSPTYLPARISGGLTFTPSNVLTIAAEGVLVRSSQKRVFLDSRTRVALQAYGLEATNESNYTADDGYEARLGAEIALKDTRTQRLAVRLGGFVEKISPIAYTGPRQGPPSQLQGIDYLRVRLSGDGENTLKHASAGFGGVFNRQWQVDVGGDYEFEREVFTGSLLLGYSF